MIIDSMLTAPNVPPPMPKLRKPKGQKQTAADAASLEKIKKIIKNQVTFVQAPPEESGPTLNAPVVTPAPLTPKETLEADTWSPQTVISQGQIVNGDDVIICQGVPAVWRKYTRQSTASLAAYFEAFSFPHTAGSKTTPRTTWQHAAKLPASTISTRSPYRLPASVTDSISSQVVEVNGAGLKMTQGQLLAGRTRRAESSRGKAWDEFERFWLRWACIALLLAIVLALFGVACHHNTSGGSIDQSSGFSDASKPNIKVGRLRRWLAMGASG